MKNPLKRYLIILHIPTGMYVNPRPNLLGYELSHDGYMLSKKPFEFYCWRWKRKEIEEGNNNMFKTICEQMMVYTEDTPSNTKRYRVVFEPSEFEIIFI